MKRLSLVVVFLSAFSLSVGCGTTWEDPGTTGQASSVLPAKLDTQPWLCAPSTWNPMTAPWVPITTGPGHGWCQWQPQPSPARLAYRVLRCTPEPGPRGTIDVYSEQNLGGACARLQGSNVVGQYYRFDTDLVQVNGWLSIWLSWDGTWQSVTIKSIRVPQYTNVSLCEGPQSDTVSCYSRQMGITTGSTAVPYNNMIYPDGTYFTTAAVAVGRSF